MGENYLRREGGRRWKEREGGRGKEEKKGKEGISPKHKNSLWTECQRWKYFNICI